MDIIYSHLFSYAFHILDLLDNVNIMKLSVNKLQMTILAIFIATFVVFLASNAYGSNRTSNCSAVHWDLPINSFNNPKIVNSFDNAIDQYSAGHRGVDLNADIGQNILAPDDGIILYKGIIADKPYFTFETRGYGNIHLKNTFEPAKTSLNIGDKVQKGQIIGTVESYDEPKEKVYCLNCLHWGLIKEPYNNRLYIDPLKEVYRKRIVLTQSD